jgi:hypothetical protein
MSPIAHTQKQIAERLKKSLDYFKRPHPFRTWRRRIYVLGMLAGTAAVMLYHKLGDERFYSPGDISRSHAPFAHKCDKCHVQQAGLAQLPAMLRGVASSALQAGCIDCHKAHDFHQPNVVANISCLACHREHTGSGRMPDPTDTHCAACHNNAPVMQASYEKGKSVPPEKLHRPAPGGLVRFEPLRPERGFTQLIASFDTDHPEFQIHREKLRDPNTLRFNHQRHEADDIPLIGGRRLDCADCHRPDATGRHFQRMTFEANCRACHALQFDPETPDLHLPHGDPEALRAFLRTLPTQYARYALNVKKLPASEVNGFVAQQMTRIRTRYRSGENLEEQAFFSTAKVAPAMRVGDLPEQGRPLFPGCAYCHQVQRVAGAAPRVTKPFIPDRWLSRSEFNHARHAGIACRDCHHVSQSRDTADVLLPGIDTCRQCHAPKIADKPGSGVVHTCITCHSYHARSQNHPLIGFGK